MMWRRRFLVYAAVLAGGSLGLVLVHPSRRRERVIVGIEAFVGDDERWLEIGRDYLTRAPAESDVATLSERLFEALQWKTLLEEDVGALLREQVRDDFRSGRVLTLRGWRLSVSEARLCALKRLLRED